MKIVNLRRIAKYPDRRLYTFNLAVGGFIINGFVFSADSGAILPPTVNRGKKRVRIVRAFGAQMKLLREHLYQAIDSLAGSDTGQASKQCDNTTSEVLETHADQEDSS